MIQQIKILTKLLMCNLWGINEWRFSKNKQKKARFVLSASAILLLAVFYVAYISLFTVSYIQLGLSDIIPAYMLTVTSLLILFFTIYKSGNIIFQMKSYDLLISMPLSPTAIIVSRFFTMYISNMLLSLITFVPITVVYALYLTPDFSFYVMMLLTVFFAPLLPMTIATAVGALIIAVSARTKHKTLVSVVLTLALVAGMLALSLFGNGMTDAQLEDMVMQLSVILTEQIKRIYPPALLFSNALINKSFVWYTMFAVISAGIFVLFVWLIQFKFFDICSWLTVKETKRNYKLQSLKQNSKIKALLKREIKHYFSSSAYVINTMIGYIMMTILGVAILVMGTENLNNLLGMPDFFSKAGAFILATAGAVASITASSISLEGKHYWILQSLPVSNKIIINSKILLNIVIALPFYIITEICVLISCHSDLLQCIWLIVTPIIYIVFYSVTGITMNLKFPVMNWENETAVVKQSIAVMLSMLINIVANILPVFLLIFAANINSNIIQAVSLTVIIFITILLYNRSSKFDLKSIN